MDVTRMWLEHASDQSAAAEPEALYAVKGSGQQSGAGL